MFWIAVAQAFKPIPISEVAHKLGLESEEYDLYGSTKAKVRYGIFMSWADP